MAVLLYKCGALMFTICQQTVSSATNTGDWFEHVDETHSHMKPAVVPDTTNLTLYV